jgi:hypothetical protein
LSNNRFAIRQLDWLPQAEKSPELLDVAQFAEADALDASLLGA